ncbi:MAG: PAS domain-containing protein [Bryobacteraceae bacterium]|nr:PAS domain-containing protein [Bryobacteraceae bacterium]
MSQGVGAVSGPWQSLAETAAAAMLWVNSEAEILGANAAAIALTGFDAAALTKQALFDLIGTNRKRGEFLEEVRKRGICPLAGLLRCSDGTMVPVEGTVSSTGKAEEGQSLVILGRGTETQRLTQAAERANAELQQFAFTVSHDLKAPLRSVKSFSELLSRRYKDKLDQDAADYLAYIVGGAREIEQLLNDVVGYSQAGREDKTRLQDLDTTGVLQWAMMNVDAMAKQTEATITSDPLPSLHADQAQLALIFQHVLTNAMKFRADEAPKIHVSSRPANNGFVEIAIADNGTGIDPQYHERIFGVFKRLVGKEVPGTGIGLAICRKIVEAQGGRMWVDSEAGRGSVFRFTLPAA